MIGAGLLLACDNCDPGDQSRFYPLLLAVAGGGLALMALAIRVAVASPGRAARWAGALAAACFLAAGPGAVAEAERPTEWHGVVCGSALSASLERGVPDDQALDNGQAGCKRRGAGHVHLAVFWGWALLAAGVVAFLVSAVLGAVHRRRHPG